MSKIQPQDGEHEYSAFWDPILAGEKDPIDIIYVAPEPLPESIDLYDIEQWGELTGLYAIRRVTSCDQALEEHRRDRANLIILFNPRIEDARRISAEFPYTPLSLARPRGWNQFPEGWPPQVVVAQWAAPREGEFMDAVEDALSRVATKVIYDALVPNIEIYQAVSNELLARLSEFPEDRFRLDCRIFEELIAELLQRMGYEVHLTPRSGDKGRDVIASIATPAAQILMLVECKRYGKGHKVGPEPITRLWYRLFDDHANMAMVVTTSSFQPVAKKTAQDRGYQITLKEGDDFIQWVKALRTK